MDDLTSKNNSQIQPHLASSAIKTIFRCASSYARIVFTFIVIVVSTTSSSEKVLFLFRFACLVLCFARVYFADPRRHKGTKDFNEYNRNSHHENKREKHHKWLFTTENLVDDLFSSPEPKLGRSSSAELRFHHSNLSDHSGVKHQKQHQHGKGNAYKKVNKLCCLLLIYHDSVVR